MQWRIKVAREDLGEGHALRQAVVDLVDWAFRSMRPSELEGRAYARRRSMISSAGYATLFAAWPILPSVQYEVAGQKGVFRYRRFAGMHAHVKTRRRRLGMAAYHAHPEATYWAAAGCATLKPCWDIVMRQVCNVAREPNMATEQSQLANRCQQRIPERSVSSRAILSTFYPCSHRCERRTHESSVLWRRPVPPGARFAMRKPGFFEDCD